MGRSQAVRQRALNSPFTGSIPVAPTTVKEKMMEKKIRFVVIASIAAIVLTCAFLALPGQFILPKDYPSLESLSGYQFFFHLGSEKYYGNTGAEGVSGLGIASIVLMVLALVSYILYKKSSAILMLGGILNVATAILFFLMETSKKHIYQAKSSLVTVGWVAYVSGALLVLTGLVTIYFSVRLFIQERKQITSKQTYSYLKK